MPDVPIGGIIILSAPFVLFAYAFFQWLSDRHGKR